MTAKLTKDWNVLLNPQVGNVIGPDADQCECQASYSPVGSPQGHLVAADPVRLKYNLNASYWSGFGGAGEPDSPINPDPDLNRATTPKLTAIKSVGRNLLPVAVVGLLYLMRG